MPPLCDITPSPWRSGPCPVSEQQDLVLPSASMLLLGSIAPHLEVQFPIIYITTKRHTALPQSELFCSGELERLVCVITKRMLSASSSLNSKELAYRTQKETHRAVSLWMQVSLPSLRIDMLISCLEFWVTLASWSCRKAGVLCPKDSVSGTSHISLSVSFPRSVIVSYTDISPLDIRTLLCIYK